MSPTHDATPLDCLVIGAGPAGLVAAVYLARFRRRLRLVDADASRLLRVPLLRNVAGFPDSMGGAALLDRLRQQAARYGVEPEAGCVESLQRAGDGFVALMAGQAVPARRVILCTGAQDIEPPIDGLGEGLRCGRVRYCPVCDGFETQHQRVAVLGPSAHGLREALFVAGFDNAVTWLSVGTFGAASPRDRERLAAARIQVVDERPDRLACSAADGVGVSLPSGALLRFDTLYPAFGQVHASALAVQLGARAQDDGQLEVDAHQQTAVPGLYAAGDVACGLNQVNVAAGQAAIAATAVHNGL